MPTNVITTDEFLDRWRTPPNFRVGPALIDFDFAWPTALEVLDAVRHDAETRVALLGDLAPTVRTARTMAFTTAPVTEIIEWPFRLVHFNLSRFYTGVLAGFQERVMIPWRMFLAAQGFTWHRCAPALFISGHRSASTFHADNSHGLVWQLDGIKTFHSYLDPDQAVPVDDAISGAFTAEHPPPLAQDVHHSVRMQPGDLLWSHALTPHWVTGETQLSMSVTLTHAGLCHLGCYSAREMALRKHWDQHPEQPWLTDLRNVRY
ncbi:hypothetical protein [Streptomyces sp. NPDC019890]|uniref:hypothetical protein n=1 Tax=Streptomyces sp. NPDC019890 TaxID=3365064 RepID=UPI0038515A34